jgi:hypothetical protein
MNAPKALKMVTISDMRPTPIRNLRESDLI